MSKEGSNIIPKSRQIEILKGEIKRLEGLLSRYEERYGPIEDAPENEEKPLFLAKLPVLGRIEIYPNK